MTIFDRFLCGCEQIPQENFLREPTPLAPPERPCVRGLEWPRLTKGILIRRYKRFLADIELKNGRQVTAHCPNSGSMLGCSEPGLPVYLSRSKNKSRRFPLTWELVRTPGSLVGVNTLVPNSLVKYSIEAGMIPELAGYGQIRSEVKCSDSSRLDIVLSKSDGNACYIEVKNCTLVENGVGYFPDARTTRGLKHLVELQKLVNLGHRGVIFFLIQRMDALAFSPADHIDPAYGLELRRALENGVEILCYDVSITLKYIIINKSIQYRL
jgi:sugar fermentation stimulation protein A